ncbi:MAG: hypothetical protein COC14_00245 [Burkholderiaceae bacterium]|nr:MAG: hypothetical protein COC14_00245 [Burkholderiaceae bacterium]
MEIFSFLVSPYLVSLQLIHKVLVYSQIKQKLLLNISMKLMVLNFFHGKLLLNQQTQQIIV